MVSEVFSRDFLVVDLMVSEVVLPAPSATRVQVSELGSLLAGPRWWSCLEILFLSSSAPMSVYCPTLHPPALPGYRGCYDSFSGHYVRHPNSIRW